MASVIQKIIVPSEGLIKLAIGDKGQGAGRAITEAHQIG